MPRPPTATEIRRATDAGRVRMLDVALRELERADKAEAKASKRFGKTGKRRDAVSFSRAAEKVDGWATVVDRITARFEEDVIKAERQRQRRVGRPTVTPTPATRRQMDRAHDAEMAFQEMDALDAEWEFQCEYLAGESASNVDINFRLRRNDGARFSKAEAERAMQVFRAQLSAGLTTAPPGYRIAGIDWRRPTKSTAWTRHGQYPRDLGDLQNVLYVASDFPSLWRMGDVDD